jgi:hypothetical protein
MSTQLNPNVPLLITVVTDLIVGALVRSSDPATETARAQTVITVGQAFVQASTGDVTDAMTAIDAAIDAAVAAKTADPATAMLVMTALSWINSKAATFQQLLTNTGAGALAGLILGQIGTAAVACAQKYLTAAAK